MLNLPGPSRLGRILMAWIFVAVVAYVAFVPSQSPLTSLLSNPASRLADRRARASRLLGPEPAIAVYDNNNFHDEVHAAVLWALSQFDRPTLRFYRRTWRYNMDLAVTPFFDQPLLDPTTLIDDLKTYPSIRAIVLTTCDWDIGGLINPLQTAWLERDENAKFTIACIRHWTTDSVTYSLNWFAEQDSVSMFGLGDHVKDYLQRSVEVAISQHSHDSEERFAAMRRIPIETFVPMVPLTSLRPPSAENAVQYKHTDAPVLQSALIQSTFWDEKHRALNRTFTDLMAAMSQDPSVFGYLPIADGRTRYEPLPNPTPAQEPFRLIFLGSGKPSVPQQLHGLLTEAFPNKPYDEYYFLLHEMSIILPAFGSEGYDVDRASSTIGVAATARVPILVTEELKETYGYFCDAFGIVRPNDVSEIEFIRRIRAGESSWPDRGKLQARLIKCQEEWTVWNMEIFAAAFTTRLRREAQLEMT